MINPMPKSSIEIFSGDHIGSSHPRFDELSILVYYVIHYIKVSDAGLYWFLSSRNQVVLNSMLDEFKLLSEESFAFSFINNINMLYKITSELLDKNFHNSAESLKSAELIKSEFEKTISSIRNIRDSIEHNDERIRGKIWGKESKFSINSGFVENHFFHTTINGQKVVNVDRETLRLAIIFVQRVAGLFEWFGSPKRLNLWSY